MGHKESNQTNKIGIWLKFIFQVYPAALRAQKRNKLQVEKLQEKQRSASAREKKKKALFNDKMSRETASWDTEYRRNYPAYSNTIYNISGPDRSPRKQKSVFVT